MNSTVARFHLSLGLLVALVATMLASPPATAQDMPLEVTRHAGATRVQTSVAVAQQSHPVGAGSVVLARADEYGDALAAAPLAAALGAPVLLTGTQALDGDAASEITRLGATAAVLIGDLGPAVADAAAAAGATAITRVDGTDAWSTYAAIAGAVVGQTGATHGLLVEGANDDPQRGWPDALAASAWAARLGVPIFLSTTDALPDATRDAIADLGITSLTIVGGTAAVSDAIAADADALVTGAVDRVAGGSRYDTAIEVAREQLDEAGYTQSVWIASGRGWPDALVAGPAAAASGGVLLLSDPTSMRHSRQTASFIDGQRGFAQTAHLVGGTAVLSEEVAESVQTGDIPGDPETTDPAPTDTGTTIDMPPPVPARNTAPPVSAAVPWSDPATWGGQLPRAGDIVTIPRDQAVLLDVPPPTLRGLQIDGTLTVADTDMTIAADWIVVTGHLAVGTEDAPLTGRIDIVLNPVDGDEIVGAGKGPIAVQGGTLDIHGQAPDAPWTRLASTATVGSTQIRLEEAPGWRVGDQIVLASTSLDPDDAEERTVTAVDGAVVTLDQPLTRTHWGQTDLLGGAEVAQRAEVGNLSRNIRVRTADGPRAARQGGHVMVFAGSVARISGAEFAGMGQAGELARYPIHFHMADSVSGSYVRGASIHHSFNRCLTIHGSHHVEVRDTIGYETFGHCFFFEDGVETGNSLHCNLGLSTRKPTEEDRLIESDETPATFWVSNPSNHLVENAAAGSEAHGFWYDLAEAPTGLSAGVEMDIRTLPFGTFRDNVAHTSGGDGWKQGIGVFVEDYEPPAPAVFEGTVAYKNESFGMWAEGVETTGAVFAENSIGFLGLDSALRDSTVVGATSNAADRTWRVTGVGFYHGRSLIQDVTFVNFGQTEHEWQHPRQALEFISHDQNQVSEVTGATFVNASRLRITQPTGDDGPDDRSAAIRDVDGSVSGAPALLTSAHPLMHDSSCSWRDDLRANVCPVSFDRTWTMLRDQSGQPLHAAWLTRSDGTEGALNNPDGEQERAYGDLLIDRAYRLRTGTPLSGSVELIMAGTTEGYLDITIPWPHGEAHVYDGWGRWHEAERVASLADAADSGYVVDTAAGVVHVRHTLNDLAENGTWQRLEICAQAFCGNDGPG